MSSTTVNLKFSIIKDSATGTAEYTETQTAMTSPLGVVNTTIGNGTASLGTWTAIQWNLGNHYLDVQVDPAGGTSFTDLGATQLVSVPYAKQANGVTIFHSGTLNPTRMVISHSGPYPTWGMQYNDNADAFENVAGGTRTSSIALGSGNITTYNPYGLSGYGDITAAGNVTTSNKVKRGSDTSNMLAIAYGTINPSGVLQVGSSNVGTITHTAGTGIYTIPITGEVIHYSTHVFSATRQSANGFITATSSGGNLYITTANTAGTPADEWFSFVIYKK